MSSVYAGTDSFPADITIPDDGDNEDAASVNVAFEATIDRTKYLRLHSPRMRSLTILATTASAWTVPERVVEAWVEGVGAGGGGGGAAGNGTNRGINGGGGGGAQVTRVPLSNITPGTSYDVSIGAGGTGGAGGTNGGVGGNGADGGDGGDTTVSLSGGGVVATQRGAGGGLGGKTHATTDTFYGISPGGESVRGGWRPSSKAHADIDTSFMRGPGSGGDGVDINVGPSGSQPVGRKGAASATGFVGGDGLGNGSGGFGGGGGGAGGYGNGGAGHFQSGVPGGAGDAAAAFTGAGGGGGGGHDAGGVGFPGGDGGSGQVTFFWIEDSP